jgi:hypothetical protein
MYPNKIDARQGPTYAVKGDQRLKIINSLSKEGCRREKIPGLKDPRILKPRKSRNKKSRDYECIKIPGFFFPAGFFPLFLCDILSEMLLNFHVSRKIQMKFPYFVMKTSFLL